MQSGVTSLGRGGITNYPLIRGHKGVIGKFPPEFHSDHKLLVLTLQPLPQGERRYGPRRVQPARAGPPLPRPPLMRWSPTRLCTSEEAKEKYEEGVNVSSPWPRPSQGRNGTGPSYKGCWRRRPRMPFRQVSLLLHRAAKRPTTRLRLPTGELGGFLMIRILGSS